LSADGRIVHDLDLRERRQIFDWIPLRSWRAITIRWTWLVPS
jgi:hypothetical protein